MPSIYRLRQTIAKLAVWLPLIILAGCGSSGASLSSFSPSSGTVGTTVTITGSDFDTTAANNSVTFNGTEATVSSSTSTQIVTTVPAGATTGPISVTVNGKEKTFSTDFTVTPSISSFSPLSGTSNTTVIITGTGFSTTKSENVVKFNGTTAVVTGSSSTSITTSVPSGASSGQITVTVNGQAAISSSIFTVN